MNRSKKPKSAVSGFALVVTLTLMVLLSILAVGMLSLSSVALRSSSTESSRQIARNNARMALMMAVGELQRHAGPDTRITARADILDDQKPNGPLAPEGSENPPVLGVWSSWEGENHNAEGRPESMGSSEQAYKSEKASRFLKWLVSGAANDKNPGNIPNTAAGTSKVTLLGEKSVGKGSIPEKPGVSLEDLQIHLDPVEVIEDNVVKGAYAWWVGGENMKARLPVARDPSSSNPPSKDPGQWAKRLKSHGTADPEPFFGNNNKILADHETVEKVSTRSQIDLDVVNGASNPPVSQKFFHDLSTSSVGLLTNAATGGWKKDMSLFTENSSVSGGPISSSGLPLFRLRLEKSGDSRTTLATSGDVRGSKSVFYPWSQYRGSANQQPIYQHPAVASWNNLINYTQLYKKASSNGITSMPTNSYGWNDTGTTFQFLHEVRVLPVIARIQWVYSYFATRAGAPEVGQVRPAIVLTPVITIWNPYNVQLSTSDQIRIDLVKPLPTSFKFTVGAKVNSQFHSLFDGSTNYPRSLLTGGNNDRFIYTIAGGVSLNPGETRVYSPTARTLGRQLALQPGYRAGNGHELRLVNDLGEPLFANATDRINTEVAFDTAYVDGAPGVGVYLDMRVGGGPPHLVYRMVYKPDVARKVYPITNSVAQSEQLSSLEGNPTEFLTTIFGARMASNTHIPAKGFLQSSPLVNYTAMGGKDEVESTIKRKYRGTDHPVNSPFDYSFRTVGSPDTNLPQTSAGTSGYIVTGFQSSNGLSRVVAVELPTRPLQSLAELQHWDLRYENPIPPYAFNLIGNSDATPLIKSNEVVAGYSDDVNLQHDDSYCANHLLFDDWFFSSIAPDPNNFGTNGRSLAAVFTDFISGTEDLPNSAYRPAEVNAGRNAKDLFAEHVNTADSWKTIASRLEVEGMFNVNSTSLTAWRAILGHARNQRIPYIDSNSSLRLSGETDFAVSRFSVAGDVEASTRVGGTIPSTEITGYRILTEDMIDALSEEIVKQVKRRGPFLSLAEFVNRQLSSGDLALAGALQAALNKIAEDSGTNPYKEITGFISRPASANPGPEAEYAFPDAAVGEGTYGLPGWTRQADILRPLAPILTVRDDTFTIRAYGDARDKNNNILAKSVCEAVVSRTRDYVDSTDAPDLETYPASPQNQAFGRKFKIVSFRWLAPDEI